MDNPDFETLRKEVKKKMIDLDLDREGSYELILPRLRTISKNQLSMALTGYRNGPAAKAILENLQQVLADWPVENVISPVCELIHDGEKENN